MRTFGQQNAMAAAKSNAAYFGQPYSVFVDTNGNWRCLSATGRDKHIAFAVVWPDGTVEKSSVETTVGDLMKRRT